MNPERPLRLGLIGCGGMGSHYADIIGPIKDVTLVACCDPTSAKLKSFAESRGIKHKYLDFHSMISAYDLDGIFNVTPDSVHAEISAAVLKSGVPLMTENAMSWKSLQKRRRYPSS